MLPNQVFGAWQSSPLVVDGIMYVTQRPNDVLAVDAKTGRVFWQYRYTARRSSASAAARTTAGSRSSATRCSWARSTRTWSPSTRRTAGRSGTRGRRSEARLLDHAGAAGRQGQGDRRRRRRRVRHPRLHRRLTTRRPARKSWRFYTIPGPGETGHETWSGELGRRRRIGVGDRLLRSGAEPDLLGRRQPGS